MDTEYLNHTIVRVGESPYGHLPSQLRVRRGTANTIEIEDLICEAESGFWFATVAFAQAVATKDFGVVNRSAQAIFENAATLEDLAHSASLGGRPHYRIDHSYRTRLGRLLSNFQPGIKYCMATASSRAPRPCCR